MIGAWLLFAGLAQASGFREIFVPENKQKLEWHCSDLQLVEGTVPWSVAVEARQSNARTYSAVAELENELLPQVARIDDGYVFRISSNSMFGVARLPSIACGELASQVFDIGAYNLSLGIRKGRFTAYYSAAATYSLVSQDWSYRTIKHGGGFILGHFYSFTAPVWGARVINADDIGGDAITDSWSFMSSGDGAIGGVSLDYIAGVSADLDYLVVGAGYVGSRGAFVHANQPQSGVFLDTVSELSAFGVGDGPEDFFRYVRTGVQAFRWFRKQRDGGKAKFGVTDADFARYRIVSPSGRVLRAADAGQPTDIEDQGTLVVVGAGQRNIVRQVDVRVEGVLGAQPALYDIGVSYHNVDYHADLIPARRGRWSASEDTVGSISAGLVNLPKRTYYGVPGGVRPYVVGDVIAYMGSGSGPNRSFFKARAAFNNPDSLLLFPYAQGATELHFSFNVVD